MKTFLSRRLLAVLSAFLFFSAVPLASNQAAVPLSRYRFFVQTSSRDEVRRVAGWLTKNQFDVAGVNLHTGILQVLTTESGLRTLQAKGLHGRIVHVPVAGGRSLHLTDLDPRYLTSDKVATNLNAIHSKYPEITRVIEIGRSLEQRPILALVISTTPEISDSKFHEKPTVLVDGMHHAREVMTPEIVFDIGESILASVTSDRRALNIVQKMNVVLVPMLNVDGNNRVWNDDSMWRKNAHAEGSSVYGVDINRNYPYNWNACDGSSGSKDDQDYRGASAASEPETRALMMLADRIHPMASLSYHSYSELVLYPFGCSGQLTSENALIESLGKKMASLLPSDGGRGTYTPGTPWQILYAVDGDSMGYLYATFGALAYTFEVNQDFQPSYAIRQATVEKHRAAWQYFLGVIQNRLATFEVRDGSGKPVSADLTLAQIPHTRGERDFATNVAGDYFKVLLPGQYTVSAKTKDGLTGIASFTMGDAPTSVPLTVR